MATDTEPKLTLTDDQIGQLSYYKELYDRIQLSTDRVDIEKLIVPTKKLYVAAGLAEPNNVVFAESPVLAAVSACFAAGLWWLWPRYGKTEEQAEDALRKAAAKAGKHVSHWFATETEGFDDVADYSLAPPAAQFEAKFLEIARAACVGMFDQPHDPAGDSDPLEGEWEDVLLRTLAHYSSFWHGGNTCAYSFSHLVALQELTGYDFGEVWEKFLLYKFCTEEAGPRMMHRNFCVYSDRPTKHATVLRNDVYINHCPDGPAVTWADGSAVYFVDGVRMPPWAVATPTEKLDPSLFAKFTNNSQRDEFIKKVGVERILTPENSKVIDEDPVGGYQLVNLNLGDNRVRPFLRMPNPSTGVTHVEGVPTDTASVNAALLWRNGIEPHQVDDENGADYYQHGEVLIKPRGATKFKSRPLLLA